jgi:hypothetical protein
MCLQIFEKFAQSHQGSGESNASNTMFSLQDSWLI